MLSACNTNCTTCADNLSCLTCPASSSRNSSNFCLCSDGYYYSGSINCSGIKFINYTLNKNKIKNFSFSIYIACNSNCSTCLNAVSCLTCFSSSNRNSSNLCLCNNGYFYNGSIICQGF